MQNDDNPRIRWSPKVQQDKIRRLYETDARGLMDEHLVDEVGIALLLRCQSILMVVSGRVACPGCGKTFVCAEHAAPDSPDGVRCPGCGWETTRRRYHDSWRHRDLWGANDGGAFAAFAERYPGAATPRERLLLIDRLLHVFHHNLKVNPTPHRSAGNNLIEGGHNEVVRFLDSLTYGDGSTPELKQTHAGWRETAREVMRFRGGLMPGMPIPGDGHDDAEDRRERGC
jgi:predicted RNA-binding Zn-ribbon protein involved in translation (DUF1610 family)